MEDNNKPLTIKDIQEVLIPAMEAVFATKDDLENFATKDDLENFATKDDLEPLATKDDLEPFATKDDLENFVTKDEFNYFKDQSLTNQDKIIKTLDTLVIEKKVADYRRGKEQQLWVIIIGALKEHRILSYDNLKKIEELQLF